MTNNSDQHNEGEMLLAKAHTEKLAQFLAVSYPSHGLDHKTTCSTFSCHETDTKGYLQKPR